MVIDETSRGRRVLTGSRVSGLPKCKAALLSGRQARANYMVLLLLALHTGCRNRDSSTPAGSEPVTKAVGGSVRIAIEPDLLVVGPDSAKPEDEFVDVRGVFQLADGRIGVADAGVPAVYILSAAGQVEVVVGRQGSGPGEFREPRLLGVQPGDTLVVYDAPLRRVTQFAGSGALVRTVSLPAPVSGATQAVGLMPGNALLVKRSVYPQHAESGGLLAVEAVYLRINTDGRIDTIARIPDGPRHPRGFLFFGWQSAAASTDSSVWIGRGDVAAVKEIYLDGALIKEGRWAARSRRVSELDRLAMRKVAELRKAPVAVTSVERFADSIPLFGRLLPDASGGVWVIAYEAPFASADSAWLIGAAGSEAIAVRLPDRFRPTQIGKEFIIGVQFRAEDDAPQVARFRLER